MGRPMPEQFSTAASEAPKCSVCQSAMRFVRSMSVTREQRCLEVSVFICSDHGPQIFTREGLRPDDAEDEDRGLPGVRERLPRHPPLNRSGIALQEPDPWQYTEALAVGALRT